MTILIVDDHAPFRTSMRSVLNASGFDVVGDAEDGETAVAAAADLEPDAVLLDVDLGPGIDGFEVARRLHELPHPPKVVITSSRDESAYHSQLETAPVLGFVAKQEFTVQALKSLLAESA